MKTFITNLLALLLAMPAWSQSRQEIILNDGWVFSRDKVTWQTVSVPHDWAISGPFDKKWDLQTVAIEQNGEKQATEKSGRSGALPWIGTGYYKRTFTIPQDFRGFATLEFDGAMAEPVISVNGIEVGRWAYGYNAFDVDVTTVAHKGENLLEVSLQNLEESSRWYPGAGLYRPVKLVLSNKPDINKRSVFIRTTDISNGKATVKVSLSLEGYRYDLVNQEYLIPNGTAVEVELRDHQGHVVSQEHVTSIDKKQNAELTLNIDDAYLWTPENPYLYEARLRLMQNGRTLDQLSVKTGLRTVSVSKEHGFQLNGMTRKLKGVCLHHDLGPLGAAVNKAALIRQVKILKEMGCDAIRTAHNMPSQMQMDICDSLGMMVMAESFDMWEYPKCKNGYARFFKEWSDKDITNLIENHRNHPSIVMWSIGNEIPEQGSEKGREIAQRLQDLCHKLDPTRPVTQGLDRAEAALKSGVAQVMDVPGFNYRVHKYPKNMELLPQGFLLGSETASTVSSRGVYKFPVEITDNSRFASWAKDYDPKAILNADGQCSSYDVEYCSWSNLPDDDWRWQDDYPWVIGEFVWTGFDYLGEPTPYDEYWPSRSSYFGICDLAGLPKDRFYLYRSRWNSEKHTLHLLPHWTWPGREGKVTPVYCYTDYDEAELFVNGKSLGRISKRKEEPGKWKEEDRLDRYRLRWNEVKYEPGELRVVAYNSQGQPAMEKTIHTAGQPARLQLSAWTQSAEDAGISDYSVLSEYSELLAKSTTLRPDGEDLAFVTVSLTDEQGTLIPTASDQLTFDVSGAGTFRAVCNGDATSLEPFTSPTMKLFSGQLVVVVQAGRQPGTLTLTVSDKERGLTQTIAIPVKSK